MKLLWFAFLVLVFAFTACEDAAEHNAPKSAPKVVKAPPTQQQAWQKFWSVSSSYKPASTASNSSVQTQKISTKNSAKQPSAKQQAPLQGKPAAGSGKATQTAKRTTQISKPAKQQAQPQQPTAQSGQGTIIIRPSDPNAPRKTHVWQAAQLPNQATEIEQSSSPITQAVQRQAWSSEPAAAEPQKTEESIGKKLGTRRRLGHSPKQAPEQEKKHSTLKRPANTQKQTKVKKKSITPSTEF